MAPSSAAQSCSSSRSSMSSPWGSFVRPMDRRGSRARREWRCGLNERRAMLYALVAELCLAFSLGCPSLISAATQTCCGKVLQRQKPVVRYAWPSRSYRRCSKPALATCCGQSFSSRSRLSAAQPSRSCRRCSKPALATCAKRAREAAPEQGRTCCPPSSGMDAAELRERAANEIGMCMCVCMQVLVALREREVAPQALCLGAARPTQVRLCDLNEWRADVSIERSIDLSLRVLCGSTIHGGGNRVLCEASLTLPVPCERYGAASSSGAPSSLSETNTYESGTRL